MFHGGGGTKRHFGGLATPSPCLAPPLMAYPRSRIALEITALTILTIRPSMLGEASKRAASVDQLHSFI